MRPPEDSSQAPTVDELIKENESLRQQVERLIGENERLRKELEEALKRCAASNDKPHHSPEANAKRNRSDRGAKAGRSTESKRIVPFPIMSTKR
jgi:regulator of replication initiation timing